MALTLNELLKKLEEQISYLSSSFKIPGMTKEDIAQELRMIIVSDYRKYPQEIYNEGWWFKRLKWFLQNKSEKEKKEPVNRSVRISKFKERD